MKCNRTGKRPTIYDLARLTNTSASTVGSVLNGTWEKRRISKQLAARVLKLANEQGYSTNLQARALRTERSGIVGMIVPMYDNRYFSSIAQTFELKAREMGLFPIVTCTGRDPELEMDAARSMLDYRVEHLICTGATDPDRITELCQAYSVRTINIDLPGSKALSIISDNYYAAIDLTTDIIQRMEAAGKLSGQRILFIGGREIDHNTSERVRGFRQAHSKHKLKVNKSHILTCGYAADKAEQTFDQYVQKNGRIPAGIFVNSTISLEGIYNWFQRKGIHLLNDVALGCFDWDPFAAMIGKDTAMVRQDVPAMIQLLFEQLNGSEHPEIKVIEIRPEIIKQRN